MNKLLYKSKPPIALFIWILLSIVIFIFMMANWGLNNSSMEVLVVFIVAFYLIFNRYSSIILIFKDRIEVKYLISRHITVIFFNEISKFDYLVGMYDFNRDFDKTTHFKNLCYDILIITMKDNEIKRIKINTSYGGFSKIINHIEDYLQKKKT